MEKQLNGQVAIITGAGGGYGRAIAEALAAAGARVAVNDVNPDRAQRTSDNIQSKSGISIAITADVANKFQCVHLIETTRQTWGRLDILVNAASVRPSVPVLKMDEWEWQRCLDVNLKGVFFMSQLCGRVMADENQARGGTIINLVAGDDEKLRAPGQAAFWASQAAVVGFTRQCDYEFGAFSVAANVLTVMTGEARPTHQSIPYSATNGGRPN